VLAINENPFPSKSTNITFAKNVAAYEFPEIVISEFNLIGPIPAKLIN